MAGSDESHATESRTAAARDIHHDDETAPSNGDPARSKPVRWQEGPSSPGEIGRATRPRVVLLSAPWCQWCRVLEHEVLPEPTIQQLLAERFAPFHVNVDAAPLWLDIPGFKGLPTFAFFDEEGRHVLTRSGYRPADDLALQLEVVADKIAAGTLDPYPAPPAARRLPGDPLSPQGAAEDLERLEGELFVAINSNDGGFHSPARHPYPGVLLELQRWRAQGSAPKRVESWITKTIEGALRGHSPRLDGEPLRDMDFDGEELRKLSVRGPDAGPRWREGIDRLPTADPYRGLRDPVDFGVFRYAAGPGWYHPHFERRALDNLAWVQLLRLRDRPAEARKIAQFVERTFADGELLNAAQQSDPFYYRLRAEERRGIPTPEVARQWNLEVQARAARVLPHRCSLLLRVPGDAWPRAQWIQTAQDPDAPPATPDAVGELLLALAGCSGSEYRKRAEQLAHMVIDRWSEQALPANARLHPLATGLCAVGAACGRALQATMGLELSLDHPPPLRALAHHAAAVASTPTRR